jgi:glycosyltransferase involved in cell wall biosynthesis
MKTLLPLDQRGPLKVLFMITSMETGGAEVLLLDLMCSLDPARCQPELACLKHLGELGEQVARQFPAHHNLIRHKLDARVIGRLTRLMKTRQIDAIVTVGAGDKMFWGRLAARRAGLPVILSALHSTGWPDNVGRLNRMLTPITDAFIAVAEPHRQYLIENEGFPASRVRLIPNGVDTGRFVADPLARQRFREQWNIPAEAPVVGIVAALRPEKNHELFLALSETVGKDFPDARFLIVGDGVQRVKLESIASTLECRSRVIFSGNCREIPAALSAMDLFVLTSHNEASPVSILEAMSCGLPVVAPRVGSIDRAVVHGATGFLASSGDHDAFAEFWKTMLADRALAQRFGDAGRQHVIRYGSLETMTRGYMELIEEIYTQKTGGHLKSALPLFSLPTSGQEPALSPSISSQATPQ